MVTYQKMMDQLQKQIEEEIERLKTVNVKPNEENNAYLISLGVSPITEGTKISELLKRSELTYDNLKVFDKNRPELDKQVTDEVEIMVKYEGYINMQLKQVEGFKKLERKLLPDDINYEDVKGIRLEARQKLNKFKPYSIGQASRISGVSPADISVLLIYLEQYKKGK